MYNKWFSRKLFVAILSLAAIMFVTWTNKPEMEGEIIEKGTGLIDLAIALLGGMYVLGQSIVNAQKVKNGSASK